MPRKHLDINPEILVEITSVGSDTQTHIHPDTKFLLEILPIENGVYARVHLALQRGESQRVLTFDKYDLTQVGSVIEGVTHSLSDFHKRDSLSLYERYARILCQTIANATSLYISTNGVVRDKACTLKFGENYAATRYSERIHMAPYFLDDTNE